MFLVSASDNWMVPVILRVISLRVPSREAPAGSRGFSRTGAEVSENFCSPSTVDPLNEYYNFFIQVFEKKTQHTVSGISVWECMWQLYKEYWEIRISLAVLSVAHNWLQCLFLTVDLIRWICGELTSSLTRCILAEFSLCPEAHSHHWQLAPSA